MKNITEYFDINESNESKDKGLDEITKGDIIYHVNCYKGRYSKIYKDNVNNVYSTEISFTIDFSGNDTGFYKDGFICIYKNALVNKKLYVSKDSYTGNELCIFATDRELLAELLDKEVPSQVEKLQKEIQNLDNKKENILKEINRLLDIKNDKYTD